MTLAEVRDIRSNPSLAMHRESGDAESLLTVLFSAVRALKMDSGV